MWASQTQHSRAFARPVIVVVFCHHKMMLLLFSDCEDLIRKMLCVDSQHRIEMRGIVTHQWLQAGTNPFLASSHLPPAHPDDVMCFVTGDDYDEFETLMAESMCPAEEDFSTLNDSVFDQLRAQNVDCQKVEQVRVFGSPVTSHRLSSFIERFSSCRV